MTLCYIIIGTNKFWSGKSLLENEARSKDRQKTQVLVTEFLAAIKQTATGKSKIFTFPKHALGMLINIKAVLKMQVQA